MEDPQKTEEWKQWIARKKLKKRTATQFKKDSINPHKEDDFNKLSPPLKKKWYRRIWKGLVLDSSPE